MYPLRYTIYFLVADLTSVSAALWRRPIVSDTIGRVDIRVVRSGRRHHVGNQRIIEAMADAGEPSVIGDQLHYIGLDSRGLELEIVAVPDDRTPGGLAVIHAMPTNFRRDAEDQP